MHLCFGVVCLLVDNMVRCFFLCALSFFEGGGETEFLEWITYVTS